MNTRMLKHINKGNEEVNAKAYEHKNAKAYKQRK